MNKIAFFDIDKTLFNPSLFLNRFFEELSKDFDLGESSEDFKRIYEKVKSDYGYFIPEEYLKSILDTFPQIDRRSLEQTFWSGKLFEKSLYPDALSINFLKNVEIGIFSKGDYDFQIKKVDYIIDDVKKENIYIYPDKIAHISEVLAKYEGYEIAFIDNAPEVLKAVAKVDNKPKLILIDRDGELEDNVGITKLESLTEVQNLI